MKRIAQLALFALAVLAATTAYSDDCLTQDFSTRAAAADWSVPVAACLSSTTPVAPTAAARPMLVTREKLMATGNAPGRSPSHLHPAGGDPVLGDGEFFEQRVDATLAGLGPHYEFRRTYRSRVTFSSQLGPSWDHSYNKRILGIYHHADNIGGREYIAPQCDNTFDFQDGELNIVHFTHDARSTATHALWSAHGTGLTLDAYPSPGDTRWQIHDADGNTLVFDTAGYLSAIVDAAGNQLTFEWGDAFGIFPDVNVYGPPKHIVRVHDGVRTVNYIYKDQTTLQCISLGEQCGDAFGRPADVLAYFDYNKLGELAVVYHGQATRGETMIYRSAQGPKALDYFPVDCLPNATVDQFCSRFCGSVNASDPTTCHNLDASTPYWDYCSQASCELKPGAPSSPRSPDDILCHYKYGAEPDPLCMVAYGMSPDCLTGCLTHHQCELTNGPQTQPFYSFGSYDDLAHNITDIVDAAGNLEVRNTYGEVPWDVSFDRVVSQTLGGASDEANTITFAYHDLAIESGNVPIHAPAGLTPWPGPYSTPDPTNVVQQSQYVEQSLCPKIGCANAPDGTCSLWMYTTPQSGALQGLAPPKPMNAVVIKDLYGTTRTQYYDSDYDLIREVNVTAGETRDYNYTTDGYLAAIQEESGVRQCFERDTVGHATQASTLPATGYAGQQTAMSTAFRFDAAQQLTDVWRDVFGTLSKTHYEHDAHERVVYEEHDVAAGQPPLRTTYSYDEDPAPVGIREIPATETLPDGTVNTYLMIDPSLGGPRFMTLDVHGAVPERSRIDYDDRGRVIASTGLAPDNSERFAIRYLYDGANQLQSVGHRDAPNSPWVSVQYTWHDTDGMLPDVVGEAQRQTQYFYLGQHPNVAWKMPLNQGIHGEQTEISCMHFGADGRLRDEILPLGNMVSYGYDAAGRLASVWKGFPRASVSQLWAKQCSGRVAPPGDPGMMEISFRQYKKGGFLSSIGDGDVGRVITTDGFGRIIESHGAMPAQVNVASHQIGYDTRGRIVWTADLAAGSAYGKPTMTTSGLLSMTEYDYDLIDRLVATRRWVVQTGEIYTTTYGYDDIRRTVTATDRGVATVSTFDGRGRLVSQIAADGSKNTIEHHFGFDVITQQTNQGTPLVRTVQYDTRGRASAVLDENNAILYSMQYDDTGHRVVEKGRGAVIVTRGYDAYDRLLSERHGPPGSGTETDFEWDANNRVNQVHDALFRSWTTVYTGFDAPLTVTDPLKRVESYSYVPGFKKPAAHIDAAGRHSCLRYDFEMRLQYVYDVDCPAGEEDVRGPAAPLIERRELDYTALGQLGQVSATADAARPTRETITYTYDSIGREIDENVDSHSTGVESYTVQHDYPDAGRTIVTQLSGTLAAPRAAGQSLLDYSPLWSGVGRLPPICGIWCHPQPPPKVFYAAFRQAYDAEGRLNAVDLNGTRMATWSWGTGTGGPLSLQYANGALTTFTYDAKLRRTRTDVAFLPAGATRATPIVSVVDGYGADSLVRMRQRAIGTAPTMTDVYQLDADARLTAENLRIPNVTMPAGEVNDNTVSYWLPYGSNWRYFGLDPDGNWDSTAAGGVAVEQRNDAVGLLQGIGTQTMAADGRGNLQNLSGDPLTFTYDDFSQVMLTAANATTKYTYVYDAADRRTAEFGSDGTATVFLWDGKRIIAHGDPSNLTIDVPGNDVDSHVASVEDTGTGKARYYHQATDQSVIAISDAGGLVEGYSYSGFGDTTVWGTNGVQLAGSTVQNRFGFQGQLFDPATATYAMRARQYVPRWGRFTTPDPMSFRAAPSLYSFTGGRPVSFRDPLGLDYCIQGPDQTYRIKEDPVLWIEPTYFPQDVLGAALGGGGFVDGQSPSTLGLMFMGGGPGGGGFSPPPMEAVALKGLLNTVAVFWEGSPEAAARVDAGIDRLLGIQSDRSSNAMAAVWGGFFSGVALAGGGELGSITELPEAVAPELVSQPSATATESVFTFRGDPRPFDIVFEEGLSAKGDSTDLLAHALDSSNPPSAFISTSKSLDVAAGFNDNVYVLKVPNGIDLQEALGAANPFPREQEIAVPWRIEASDIRAVTRTSDGVSILNPNWKR